MHLTLYSNNQDLTTHRVSCMLPLSSKFKCVFTKSSGTAVMLQYFVFTPNRNKHYIYTLLSIWDSCSSLFLMTREHFQVLGLIISIYAEDTNSDGFSWNLIYYMFRLQVFFQTFPYILLYFYVMIWLNMLTLTLSRLERLSCMATTVFLILCKGRFNCFKKVADFMCRPTKHVSSLHSGKLVRQLEVNLTSSASLVGRSGRPHMLSTPIRQPDGLSSVHFLQSQTACHLTSQQRSETDKCTFAQIPFYTQWNQHYTEVTQWTLATKEVLAPSLLKYSERYSDHSCRDSSSLSYPNV